MRVGLLACALVGAACAGEDAATAPADAAGDVIDAGDLGPEDATDAAVTDLASDGDATTDAADVATDAGGDVVTDAPEARLPLEVRFLGVQGFLLRHGDDAVLTAPLFTRASVVDVSVGRVTADERAIAAGLAPLPLADVSAVVSGHAHYDHLMDVPHTLRRAPRARVYANLTAAHMLAALAPDRPATCDAAVSTPSLPRDRVVALDDPAMGAVDYRNCPAQRPAGAALDGRWVSVPDSRVRIRPLCSMHPDQVWVFHFGAGAVATDQCSLPERAGDWLEGSTLAFLIDFLDDSGRPAFRVYYQDAPTDGPIGYVPDDVLAEKRIDVALLCVGSYDAVRNQPTETIAALRPRFALSGHWEDFFVPASMAPRPIPFLDLGTYTRRAEAALPPPADAPLTVDDRTANVRHVVAQPGSRFVVPAAP